MKDFVPPPLEALKNEDSRRRTERLKVVTPVVVKWTTENGYREEETAETEVVNAHGALLRLHKPIQPLTNLEVTHLSTEKTAGARAVWLDYSQSDKMFRVGIELYAPSQLFWGISFPTAGHRPN